MAFDDVGVCVVPVAHDGSKRPQGQWKHRQSSRPTTQELVSSLVGSQGFGIVTGAVSGSLEMLELEGRAVRDGLPEQVRELAQAAGLGGLLTRIVNGYAEQTPGGGVHFLYRIIDGSVPGNEKLARGLDDNGKIAVLAETRGEGGFVITAPSAGPVHPSGNPYVQILGGPATIAEVTREERDEFVNLFRSLDATPRDVREESSAHETGSRPGDEYNRLTSWDEILIPLDWTVVARSRGVTHWRRPGKSFGLSATRGFGDGDYLYVFSTSTEFEAEKAYSKFAAYALLEHGSDFSAAARQLKAEGYGARDGIPMAPPSVGDAVLKGVSALRRRLVLAPVSDLKLKPVHWLWEGRLPTGSLALLAGREGLGKSTIAYWLTARITRGDLPGESFGLPRAVIVAATEDSWEHTIGPRLVAAGADLARVYRVDVITTEETHACLSFPLDNHRLLAEAEGIQAALILLDPLMSRIDAGLDTHKDPDVRRALEPLADLADKTGAVVLGLIHLNKGVGNDALTSVMGSRAFVAVARAVLAVVVDPEDENRRLLGLAKNNLGRSDLPSLVFRIVSAEVATDEGPAYTGRVEWEGESTTTVDAAMREYSADPDVRSATDDAGEWLVEYLHTQGGRAESKHIREAARAAGHSDATLGRARRKVGVAVESIGYPRRTHWSDSRYGDPVGPAVKSWAGESDVTDLSGVTETNGIQSAQLDHAPTPPDTGDSTQRSTDPGGGFAWPHATRACSGSSGRVPGCDTR
jgi:hypothetical protein